MNIAIVILHAHRSRGGAERHTIELADALLERGHDVSLIAASFTDAGRARQIPAAHVGLTRTARYRTFLSSVEQILGRERFDVVHTILPIKRCDVYQPQAGYETISLRDGHQQFSGLVRAGKWIAHRLNVKRRSFASVERAMITRSDCTCLCLSRAMMDNAGRTFGIAGDRLELHYNAVDLSRFEPRDFDRAEHRRRWKLDSNELVYLVIAQDFVRKGVDRCVRALAELPSGKLVVVGKPDPRPYAGLAERLGVGSRVVFAGPSSDVRPFYAMADVFVLPTTHDPCSIVVLEALAMGVPVITSSVNGASDFIQTGKQGVVLHSPTDVSELAAAMRKLADPGVACAMGGSALLLRPSLSSQRRLDELEAIYERIIHARYAKH